MIFKDLKQIINRSAGRHDYYSISIGLGNDALIQAESPLLDALDDYEVAWIAPDTMGRSTVTEEERPVIEVHLKEGKAARPGCNGWIPINDELPLTDSAGLSHFILVSFANGESPRIGRYEKYRDGSGAFLDGYDGDAFISKDLIVTAWMPLPEPYEEGKR